MKKYSTFMIESFFVFIALLLCAIFAGCTLSFNNVMTSGTATDVVDSDPKTDSQIEAEANLPIHPLIYRL